MNPQNHPMLLEDAIIISVLQLRTLKLREMKSTGLRSHIYSVAKLDYSPKPLLLNIHITLYPTSEEHESGGTWLGHFDVPTGRGLC